MLAELSFQVTRFLRASEQRERDFRGAQIVCALHYFSYPLEQNQNPNEDLLFPALSMPCFLLQDLFHPHPLRCILSSLLSVPRACLATVLTSEPSHLLLLLSGLLFSESAMLSNASGLHLDEPSREGFPIFLT